MAAQSSGPTFPVHLDERELAEDLAHASDAGRAAIEPMVQRLKADGAPKLFLLAVGERHPGPPWAKSVYEVAHRRLHRRDA